MLNFKGSQKSETMPMPYYLRRKRASALYKVTILGLVLGLVILLTACGVTAPRATAPKVSLPSLPNSDTMTDAQNAELLAEFEAALRGCNAALPDLK